jgi:hypothetical protein
MPDTYAHDSDRIGSYKLGVVGDNEIILRFEVRGM